MFDYDGSDFAAAGYEGWVAWVNDGGPIPVPIFEANPIIPTLAPLIRGAKRLPVRPVERNVKMWDALDQTKIQRLDLFFYPTVYDQPAWRVDREPGFTHMRFIQMKMGGLRINAYEGDPRETEGLLSTGVARTGLTGYRVGYWDTLRNISEIYEITLMHRTSLGVRGCPCNPRPRENETLDIKRHGWALSPHVVGMTQEEVQAWL